METKLRGQTIERRPLIDMDAPEPLATVNRSAMSRAIRVDLAHVSRMLSGQRNPSWEVAKKIAKYLGVSLDQLRELLEHR